MAAGLVGGAPALAQPPPTLRIVQAAARVVVIPEARTDVAVMVRQSGAALPPVRLRRQGGTTILDGRLAPNLFDRLLGRKAGAVCIDGAVLAQGRRWRPDQLPVVTVRVPLDARIEAAGALFGVVGPTSRLRFTDEGCGDWSLGPTAGLILRHGGAGVVRVAGASTLDAGTTGRGTVIVANGQTGRADLFVKGAGRIDHRGTVGRLKATVTGPGRIDVALVTGTAEVLTARTMGRAGEVHYGRPAGRHYSLCESCR